MVAVYQAVTCDSMANPVNVCLEPCQWLAFRNVGTASFAAATVALLLAGCMQRPGAAQQTSTQYLSFVRAPCLFLIHQIQGDNYGWTLCSLTLQSV